MGSSEHSGHPALNHSQDFFFSLTASKSARLFGEDWKVLLGLIISLTSVLPSLSKMYRNFQTMTSCISTFSSPQGPVLETKGMFGARLLDAKGSDS